jgi:hypothetical protein
MDKYIFDKILKKMGFYINIYYYGRGSSSTLNKHKIAKNNILLK